MEHLAHAHLEFLWRVLARQGVRDGDVHDAAQRVLLTAHRKLECVDANRERAFLHKVAVREAGHMRRSYARRREVEVDYSERACPSSAHPDRLVLRKQDLATARELVRALADDLQAVFVRHELGEMSLRAVAVELGLPLGTVKTRLRRARAALASQGAKLPAE